MLKLKNAGSRQKRLVAPRMAMGILLTVFGLGLFSGCSTMPNPAKRLVNHLSTKTSEARLRGKVENDKFPSAKEAGVE